VIHIPLTKGQRALIDDSDANLILPFTWFAIWRERSRTFYAARQQTIDGVTRTIPMHRWIVGIEDPAIEIDHRNHIGTDNRRENLRICTHTENVRNRRGWGGRFKGVRLRRAQWEARIRVDSQENRLQFLKRRSDSVRQAPQRPGLKLLVPRIEVKVMDRPAQVIGDLQV